MQTCNHTSFDSFGRFLEFLYFILKSLVNSDLLFYKANTEEENELHPQRQCSYF